MRRGTPIWVGLCTLALLWPSRVSGPLDGVPLDNTLELIALGIVAPALCWFRPRFLTTWPARSCVLALLAVKAAGAIVLVPEGWCAAVDPARPYVRDQTGRPHAWDLRADWWRTNPSCTALMTRSYAALTEFPVWFYNLPAADGELPRPEDIPPDATTRMTLTGYLTVADAGVFRLVTSPDITATVTVDGRVIEAAHGAAIGEGRHQIAIDTTLVHDRWVLKPTWNDRDVFRAAVTTTTSPSAVDLAIRPMARWATALLVSALLTAWLAWALRPMRDWWALAWVVAACAMMVVNVTRITQYRWHYAVAALALSAALPLSSRVRSGFGAFLLIGVPWLVFVTAYAFPEIGQTTRYGVGNDFWQFQRYAYRIYLQGYWLEGGERTFWFQPLYRWIAGALHMVFGDSSAGEKLWDAAGLFAMAGFAFHVSKAVAGARWGLVAAAATLGLFMAGPGVIFLGRGLSEISSAGFIYTGALFAIRSQHGSKPWAVAAGVCATLAFYTRLNNLPMAAAIALFAWPLRVPIRQLWRPSTLVAQASRSTFIVVSATLALGMGLFALRTWHYTGTLSVFLGTQAALLQVWRPEMSFLDAARAALDSVVMVLATTDPPKLHTGAMPFFAAPIVAVAAVAGLGPLGRLPFALPLFALASLAGAVVARGSAYPGRFSIHIIGAMTALLVCAVAQILDTARSALRPPTAAGDAIRT